MPFPEPIPIVAIGVYRAVAVSTNTCFTDTPYRIAAVLDLNDSPKAHAYSAQNLGTVLWTLAPRPKAIIIGAGISAPMADEAMSVWEYYLQGTRLEDGLAINLSKHPPRNGDWMAEILRQLDGKYKQ